MTPNQLIREFRLDVDDTDTADPLWIEEELINYLNQGINELVQETEVLIESEDPMTQLAVTADDPWVPYDDKIIRFERICHDLNTDRRLEIISILNLHDDAYENDYGLIFSSPRWKLTKGTPRALISDMQTQKLRAYPIPVENTTIATTVRRMPMAQITNSDLDSTTIIEIPERFHRKLLVFMKMRGYGKEDAETYDQRMMLKHTAEWEAVILDVKNRIKREREKRPRVVKYRDAGQGYGRSSYRGRYYRQGW